MTKPVVLIASFLESELVDHIRREVPDVDIIYRPDLLGRPSYPADHTSPPERTPRQEGVWRNFLEQAEILFDFDVSHRADLPELAPNLKWIQATSAGIGQLVKQYGYAERTDWIFTTASGVHARPLAEFVIMSMLMFAKDVAYLQREQAAHHWQRYSVAELSSKTLAIVGLGKIGRETARLAKAFDMRVIASRRHDDESTQPNIDALYSAAGLPNLLSQADYLVLCVPHTPETERLIGAAELALLPRHAVLINVARGAVLDHTALAEALQFGNLRGAVLDVTDPEPLPPDNPLWAMPNVLISPHSASTADSENRKIVELFCYNLKRYLAGQPLINRLDPVRMY